jgi:large conductance mechanosensitive channel
MKIVQEFREFIARGNVIDLAVGIIIGASFTKIVDALVTKVIMPPIGLITGGVDFSYLKVLLKPAGKAANGKDIPEVAIGYGDFVNTIIQFLIVAAAVFLLVKLINSIRRKEEAKPATPPAPSKSEVLLEEIRDLLKSK